GIAEGQVLQFAYPFFGSPLGGGVTENLHRSYDCTGTIPHRQDTHTNRHAMTVLVPEVDLGFFGLPVGHRGAERTCAGAQRLARLIDVRQEVVETVLSDGVRGAIPRQPLGAGIPVRHLAIPVY